MHAGLLDRLERFYDGLPREAARAEDHGGLVLFIRNGPGWPFYARPRRGASRPPTLADLSAVRARQRALGLPEALEWVHESTPGLLAVARSAGLSVHQAPLMVLDPAGLPDPATCAGVPTRVLSPTDPDLSAAVAARRAVAAVGFSVPGTGRGPAGPTERDAALAELDVAALAEERAGIVAGRRLSALVRTAEEGVLAGAMAMRLDDAAEIAGVATLPAARRRGLATAVTAALARALLAAGVDLVFLAAGDEEIARVYLRVGFRRVATACTAN